MKIVYLISGNIYMNSSANIRNIALIKGLEKSGNIVEVYYIDNNKKKDNGFEQALSDSNVHALYPYNVDITKKSELRVEKKNQISKMLKAYLNKIYKHIQIYDPYRYKAEKYDDSQIEWRNFDVCITSSDPKSSHLMGYKAKRVNPNIVWVQYWGDPMTLDLTFKSWVKFLIKKEELRLYNSADKIVFTNQAATEEMIKKYPQFCNKFMDIPSSIYEVNKPRKKEVFNKNRVELGYFGGCSKINRNIVPLVNAIKENSRYCLTIAGGNDLGLSSFERLDVYDRVNSDKIIELTNKVDILVVLENLPKNNDIKSPCKQVPGKMYHYALMGYPILVVCETATLRELFRKYDNYYFCENNEKSISFTIKKICDDITAGKVFDPIENFMPDKVACQLIKAIRE